jgi:Kef-type K+ transport system membrane component KefB
MNGGVAMLLNDVPVLMILGLLFLVGLAADLAGRHSFIPRVTLLICSGLAVGPSGLDLIPASLLEEWFPPLTTLALSLVGFLLGQKLSISELREHGRLVLGVTLGETTGALIAVAAALLLIGLHPVVALLLAGSRASFPTPCWRWWRSTMRSRCCSSR